MSKPDDPLTRAIGRILDDPTALARVIDERETARLIGISSATGTGSEPPATFRQKPASQQTGLVIGLST